MASTTIATIVLLAVIQAAMCNKNCSRVCYPSEFFPELKGNLTKIVWAHAVNSMAELEKALSSGDVMMLEADVVMGKLNNTTNSTEIPIMAHPPATESDLSLEEFLNISNNNGSKGIKLDFKSNEAFDSSKSILTKLRPALKYPVFLNADILSGPVNATTAPLNAKDFLKGANDTIPEAVLSVGWTTRYGKESNITEGRYTTEQLKKMVDTLKENRVTQPVTYPVRAGLAANDIDGITALLKNTTFANATLTIWSSEGDSVDAAQLSKLIREVGVDKVYVDVPKDLRSKLNLSGASAMTSAVMMNLGASLALLVLSRML
ncbi:protein FAM151B isoform X1 [Temnothorax americanus]|uniref:protein FAM151B isoform X1 n=2 Tax=Temnothorax americanus TaxID=1964332 RepID=UPI004068A018